MEAGGLLLFSLILFPLAALAGAGGEMLGSGRRGAFFPFPSALPRRAPAWRLSFAFHAALAACLWCLAALGALILRLGGADMAGAGTVLVPAAGGELAAALSLLGLEGGGGAVLFAGHIRGLAFATAPALLLLGGGVPFAVETGGGGGTAPAARLFAAAALLIAASSAAPPPESAPPPLAWQKELVRFGLLLTAAAFLAPFPGEGGGWGVFAVLLLVLHFLAGLIRGLHPPSPLSRRRAGWLGAGGAVLIAFLLAAAGA